MNRHITRISMAACLVLLTAGGAFAADVEKALETSLESYSLTGSPRDAVAKLAKTNDVKIQVDWEALQRADANLTEKVVVKGKNATLGQVLELLLAQIAAPRKPLGYYVEDNAIHVTTQSRVISRRTRAALSGPSQSAGRRTAQARKARPAPPREYKFEGTPLQDVVQYFRDLTGLNFHVNWRSLQAVGVDRSTPISFQARGVSIATALDLMLKDVNADKDRLSSVYWVVDKGIVRIATGNVFDSEMRTVVYDIADLLAVMPQFKAPRMDVAAVSQRGNGGSSSGSSGSGESIFPEYDEDDEDDTEELSAAELRAQQKQAIVKTIKESIGEDMWRPTGKGSITILSDRKQLVITQSLLGFKLMRQTLGS